MLPSQKDIELPLLEVLEELGGKGYTEKIYQRVADKFPQITDDDRKVKVPRGSQLKWKNDIAQTRRKLVDEEYLFSWDEIPGNDSKRLISFLEKKFSIDWIKSAKIEKTDNDKIIKVYTEKNFLLLKLNTEKDKLNLEIDDGRIYELNAKTEKDKLKIYQEGMMKPERESGRGTWEISETGKKHVRYLFCWDDIPRYVEPRLKEFLKKNFGIDWDKTPKIEKIDNGKIIKVSTEKKSFLLKLNDKEVNLEIDDDGTDKFVAEKENNRLNVYRGPERTKETEPPKIKQNILDIYQYISAKGFYFPKEIITNYYLALKTKPFVILTGISGTGKTKIAQLFSEYICAEKSMYVFVSVRPDWMDNRGILGFYNFLTEKYEATELIKLILRAKKEYEEKGKHSRPYFVILDEMNLSKVEQYFSDFLSCLESRTPDNNGEPIILHNNPLDKDGKKIILKTEDLLEIPDKVKIPPNIFFTGTVNIDETTYMFSHKVLDRANVIEFDEVDLSRYFGDDSKDVSQFILQKKPELTVYLPVTKKIYDNAEMLNVYITHLEEINRRLTPHNLHFGYRVVNEIGAYLKNAEEMVTNYQDKLDDAFDFQIRQKILTKFHGSRQKIEKPLQDMFLYLNGNSIENQNLSQSTITEEHGKLKGWITKDGEQINYSGKFPRSAAKILRMLKNLHEQGFTSYIE